MGREIERLTDRQKECLRLVGDGYTSKEIGRQLEISYTTVDNHIRSAMEVLDVDSRAEAARMLRSHYDQPLTSQPRVLAAVAQLPSYPGASDPLRQWWQKLVPPLGGELHELSKEGVIFQILRIAFVAFAGLILLSLGTVILLWLLR